MYPLHDGSDCNCLGTAEECRAIGAENVQRVIHCLSDKFSDIHLFNACKLFYHCYLAIEC